MRKVLFCVLSLFLLSSCDPIEYDIFGGIDGKVVDVVTNLPIENVSVQLSPGGSNVVTSNDGVFKFSELDPKQYTITVQKNGYETNLKMVNVMSSEISNVSITMKKRNY